MAGRGPREYAVGVAVDAVRSAYEALGEGDVEPLVALIHPDMEWRGRRRLRRFLRAPS
jgi:ketosteroid isomerase-like protein